MSLRPVTYVCYGCMETSVFRFAASYVPFARWLVTCRHCRGRLQLHVATKRPLTRRFR